MPTYSVRCNQCGKRDTFVAKVDDRNNTPLCCAKATERLLDTPMVGAMVWSGWKAFHLNDGKNEGKGTWIETGDAYERYLKTNNKLSGTEGEREAEIQAANRQAADDKKLDAAVEQAVRAHNL